MKVKELIEKLQELPPEDEVVVSHPALAHREDTREPDLVKRPIWNFYGTAVCGYHWEL